MDPRILMKHSTEELSFLLDTLDDVRDQGIDSNFTWTAEANEPPDDTDSVTSNDSLECIYLNDDDEDDSVLQWNAEESPPDLKVCGLAHIRQRLPSFTCKPHFPRVKGLRRALPSVPFEVTPIVPMMCGTDSDDTRSSSKGSRCSSSKRGWFRLPSPKTSSVKPRLPSKESGLSSTVPKTKEAWA